MKSTNPLRYPGGKFFLANYVDKVLEVNQLHGCAFYEPYAGSAAVAIELLLAEKVEKIVIIERDPLIYAFWMSVVGHTNELCEKIQLMDVSLETWVQMQKYKHIKTPLECPTLDLGIAGLFLNRTNYSGILKANPLGGKSQTSEYKIDCRFNKAQIIKHIERISEKKSRINIHWGDALLFLRNYKSELYKSNCFVYIDPPYYQQGKNLYRYFYTDDDHRNLAAIIKRCYYPWLISYDEHDFIRNLYFSNNSNLRQQNLHCDYTAQKHKKGNELLISNLNLPPIEEVLPLNNTNVG